MERLLRAAFVVSVALWGMTYPAWAESPQVENLPVPGGKPPEEIKPLAVEPTEVARLTFIDRRMAVCLAVDAQTGVDLANWVAVHSRNPRVKQFAQAVAVESIAYLKLLDERTDGKATAALRDSAEPASDSPDAPSQRRMPTKLNILNAERVLMRIKCEVAEGSSDFLVAQLEGCPAESLDVTYVGGEVFRQVQLLNTLKVFKRYGSKVFEPLLDDGLKMTERHLAKTLAMLRTVSQTPRAAPTAPAVAETK